MRTIIFSALAGTMLLLSPASFAGNIEPYQAKQIEVYRANEIEPNKAKTMKPHKAKQVKADKAKEVEPAQDAGQVRLFTKEERRKMLQNDRDAGRTRDSMSKKNSSNQPTGKDSVMFKDPYNTGGWNYNTNQPASPIWNPNSQ